MLRGPASTSIHRPRGVRIAMASPCPTSIAVICSVPRPATESTACPAQSVAKAQSAHTAARTAGRMRQVV